LRIGSAGAVAAENPYLFSSPGGLILAAIAHPAKKIASVHRDLSVSVRRPGGRDNI
jgi:hypothetical protein